MNNRIKFNEKGIQKNFILRAKNSLELKWYEFAQKLKISPRTLADWKREEVTISEDSAKKISKLTNIAIPKNHSITDWRIHLQNAGKIGGRSRFIKHGSVSIDEEYRKKKWREWWKKTGRYSKNTLRLQTPKKIKIPKRSKLLAEFVGIMLGDGGITPYHIDITLGENEKNYIQYVGGVIYKLFSVIPKTYELKTSKATSITVGRKALVNFCQEIGLVLGNKIKQQIDIPNWIIENKTFLRECIRGLFDTDGCFFIHNYVSHGRRYSYLKITFTSASAPLVDSVADALINLGINVRISKNYRDKSGRGGDVRIDDALCVKKYIQKIGTHNQKHLDKIKKWKDATNGKSAVC